MTPRIIGAPLPPDQVEIIDALKETLAQALEGKVTSLAIVACFGDGGIGTIMKGRQASVLNLAFDELKAKILAAVTEGK